MADEVARLVAVMEANLRGFTRGMEQAQRVADQRFGQIERRMSRTEQRFRAGFSGIGSSLSRFLTVAAITAFTRSLINTADKLVDTATQIGITTQELQELQFAARVTGGSAEAMAGQLGILNDRLGDAARGEGELAEIMRELNIPLGDAKTVLLDLADATKNAATQADRARIATAAFGRAGKDNISFLNEGADGIRRLADEAHRLNQVWDDATIQRLDRLKESFHQLGAALTNMAADPISKSLEGMSQFLNDLQRGNWEDRLQALARFFTLGDFGAGIPRPDTSEATRLREIADELARVDRALGSTRGTQAAGLQATKRMLLEEQEAILEARKAIRRAAAQESEVASDVPRTAVPDKPGSAGDEERRLLEFLGLPDLPSGEAFMELYWQTMADRAEAARGEAIAARRGDARPPITAVDVGRIDVTEDIQDAVPRVEELQEQFDFFTETAKDGLVDVGLAAVRSFDDAQEAAGRLLERLGDMILEFGVLRPLIDAIFGGSGSGGLLGSLFEGFFAQGGVIPRGKWGIVGENGPEAVFSGAQGARVVTNAQMPRIANPISQANKATVIVNQTFSLAGANGDEAVHRIARMHAAEAATGTFGAVRRAMPGFILESHKRAL